MTKKIKLSNTAIDLYEVCPRKYFYRYVEKLKGDFTSTPLLFGTSIDTALNYILESIRDKKEWSVDQAKELFLNKMQEWDGQNRLDFFKSEVPAEMLETYDEGDPDTWEAVWDNVVRRGLACIDVYVREVIPQIKEVISVQNKGVIVNEEGHEFTFVLDFIAKLQDDRVVLFDNKTSSAKYPKNKVKNSQQLSLYLDQFPEIQYAGYIVLIKNPEKEKGMTHQILVDEIPEETRKKSFDKLDKTLYDVSCGKFEKNTKSCRLYNKPCEYSALCNAGIRDGLVSTYREKNDTSGSSGNNK